MLREEVDQVREIVREEISTAIKNLKQELMGKPETAADPETSVEEGKEG